MTTTLILAATVFAIVALVTTAASRAWQGWLELKRLELARGRDAADPTEADTGVRIELAAVRERLKKLEAIANGVEL